MWSTKPAWCSLSCLQALDHRVRTLTSDLSAQNDSVTKFQKEKRALEEVHQAEITAPFFFTFSHSHSPSLGKGKKPNIVCLLKYCQTTVCCTNRKGAVFFYVLTHGSTVKCCQFVPLPKRAMWIAEGEQGSSVRVNAGPNSSGPIENEAHTAFRRHIRWIYSLGFQSVARTG